MFEQTFKNIDDKLWKDAGCSSELDTVEQTFAMLLRGRSLPEAISTKKTPPAPLKGHPPQIRRWCCRIWRGTGIKENYVRADIQKH